MPPSPEAAGHLLNTLQGSLPMATCCSARRTHALEACETSSLIQSSLAVKCAWCDEEDTEEAQSLTEGSSELDRKDSAENAQHTLKMCSAN